MSFHAAHRAPRRLPAIVALAASLALCALPCRSVPAPAADPTAALAREVQDYAAKGKLDGVVLVARGGRVLYQGASGLANQATGAPNRVSTVFPICSITKQFTAVLVMQQVERGKISLDAPITRYLPEFRRDTGSKITVENLLTHTSGLPNSDNFFPVPTDSNEMPPFYTLRNPAEYAPSSVITHHLTSDLLVDPGSRFSYNNADYIVLSEILRRVTGKPFATLLRDNITRPLHMTHTGVFTDPAGKQPADYARDYIHFPGGLVDPLVYARKHAEGAVQPMDSINLATFDAAGAMYSTAADLLLWNQALLAHKLLGKPAQDRIFTAVPNLGYEGLSTWIYPLSFADSAAKPILYERDGQIGGYSTLDVLAPEEGVSLIILSNTDNFQYELIYERAGFAYELLRCVYAPPPSSPAGSSIGYTTSPQSR